MFKLKVTYYLNTSGIKYFPEWYSAVVGASAQQEGFRGLSYEPINDVFIVYLYFQDEQTLDYWCAKDEHEVLTKLIEAYFVKSPEVEEMTASIVPPQDTNYPFKGFKNIGKATLEDLERLGIKSVQQLADADPDELYLSLQELTGIKQDSCVWDVFMAIIHEASTGIKQPWWAWTPIRKKRQAVGMFLG